MANSEWRIGKEAPEMAVSIFAIRYSRAKEMTAA